MLATDRWMLGAGFLAKGWSVNDSDPGHIAAVRDQLIATKKRILAFDDTTFYSKLASGESLMAHAWDGWCNYGTQANAAIKFVVPKEGSDLWVDTMVVLKSSKHQDEAFKFVNFMLAKENHVWVAENILYKIPNQAAMAGLSADLLKQYPNLTIAPRRAGEDGAIARPGRHHAKGLHPGRHRNHGGTELSLTKRKPHRTEACPACLATLASRLCPEAGGYG